MFKMKKMSLVALGAATLFMAPAVVHADETGVQTTDTTTTTTATVDIDGETPVEEVLSLDSAPTLNFGKVNSAEESGTKFTKGSVAAEDTLQVTNTKNMSKWQVHVSMVEGFKSGDDKLLPDTDLTFNSAGMSLISESKEQLLIHDGVQVDEENSTPVFSSYRQDDAPIATGTHALHFNDDAVTLRSPVGAPAGVYTATIKWDLQQPES